MTASDVKKIITIILVIFVLCVSVAVLISLYQNDRVAPPSDPQKPDVLDEALRSFHALVDAQISSLRSNMSVAALNVSSLPLTDPAFAEAMRQLYVEYPYMIDIVFVDDSGTVRLVVPDIEGSYVNPDMSTWPKYAVIREFSASSFVPLMSHNANAVCIYYPVYASDGSYRGYLSAAVDPIAFFGSLVYEFRENGLDPWVIDSANRSIYTVEYDRIGREIRPEEFEDQHFADLFTSILKNDSGGYVYAYEEANGSVLLQDREVRWISYPIGSMNWKLGFVSKSAPLNSVSSVKIPENISLETFVSSALAYACEHGETVALAEFNNPNGVFSLGERYIYAYTMGGTVLSIPYERALVGQNRYQIQDDYGVQYVRSAIDVAQRGGGYFYYLYANPAKNYTKEFKIGYVLRVNDNVFLGSGDYSVTPLNSFNRSLSAGMVHDVRSILSYISGVGKDAALTELSGSGRSLLESSDYLFAVDMEGNVLLHSKNTAVVGTNGLGLTDVHGVSYIRDSIVVAKHGGGSLYMLLKNPVTGKTEMCLCYVEPVDDTWLIGVGAVIS